MSLSIVCTMQLSVVDGGSQVTIASQPDVGLTIISGMAVITGEMSSTTMTLKTRVEVFPSVSLAVMVTGVEPMENGLPDGISVVTGCKLQLSVTDGRFQLTLVTQLELPTGTVMSFIVAIVGGKLSITVTLKLHKMLLPERSVAV